MTECDFSTSQPAPDEESIAAASLITVSGHIVRLDGFTIESPSLVSLLAGSTPAEQARLVHDVITIGTRGVTAVTMNATVDRVDARFEQTLQRAIDRLQAHVTQVLGLSAEAVDAQLDPDRRSSMMSRAIAELATARNELVEQLDLRRSDSHSHRLLTALAALIGPEGELHRMLAETLDVGSEESGLAQLARRVDDQFGQLRDLIVREAGVRVEAERGTAKGLDFEHRLEAILRDVARAVGECTVEVTGSESGSLTAAAKVGDFVIEDRHGHRVVIEAKNKASLTLTGRTGILSELDRAIANRRAHFGICVSAVDAFPAEVGTFGRYGNRLLVVDDGSGVLLEPAVRWAFAQVAAESDQPMDTTQLRERFERVRRHTTRLSAIKRSLSALKESVDKVNTEIGVLQTDLRQEFDDIEASWEPSVGLRVVGDG